MTKICCDSHGALADAGSANIDTNSSRFVSAFGGRIWAWTAGLAWVFLCLLALPAGAAGPLFPLFYATSSPNPSDQGQSVTVEAVFTQAGGGAPTAGGTVTIDWGDGSALVTLPGLSGTASHSFSATGLYTINVTYSGDFNYQEKVVPIDQQVGTPQTITFGAQAGHTFSPYGTFAISPLATASSNLAVSYSSLTTGVCTVSGATVTMVNAGICTIAADQAGNATYAPAPQVTQDIAIGKAGQSITFGAQAGREFSSGGAFAISPLATASSNLAVSYSSLTTGVCTVSGTTVTMVAVGTCTIAADQPGDTNYNAAAQVTQNVAINKANQTISFGGQAGQTFSSGGTFAISPLATASSNLAVSYSSLTTGVCTVSGTTVTMVAVGTCTIAADQAGDATYNAAPQVTQNVAINKVSQSISFGAQAGQTFSSGGTFAISPTATASSNLAVSYSSLTTGVCTVTGTTVTMVSAGTCTIAADQAGDATYNAAPQVTQNVAINKVSQTITFDAQAGQTFSSGGTFAISPTATASSNLAVSYSSLTTGVCTVSGTTVTMVGAGTCTIAADQAGDATYNAAPQVTQNVAIAKANQTITFDAQAGRAFSPGGTFAISPTATASSGLTVAYSSLTTGVCTVSGTTVTMVSAGTCTIAADQPGDGNYNAASQVTQNVAIAKANQTIIFDAQASRTFSPGGTFAISPTATASSGLTVDYSSLTTGVCTVSGTTVTMVSAGTCTIAADQAGDATYNAAPQVTQNVAINKVSQTVTFDAQAGQTFSPGGTFAISPTATASSGLTVDYSSLTTGVCTVSGTTVTMASAGTCTIAADQSGDGNYNAAPQVTQNVAIGQANQTITFDAQAGQTFSSGGTFAISPEATASSGLTVAYSSLSTGVCTVSGTTVSMVNAGTCTIAADQAGDGNYTAAAQETQGIAIGKADQTISFTQPAAQVYTAGLTVPLVASVASGLPVAFSSNTSAVCTVSGATVSVLGPGACSITATQPGDANYNPAAAVTRTFQIQDATTITTVSFSPSSPLMGQVVTFSVAVTSAMGTPSGTVAVLDGGSPLCTVTLSNGTGKCTASFGSGGAHTVTAEFAGSSPFASSTSSPVTVTVIDQRARTAQVIGQFLSQRNNQILSNQPDTTRQIDRLQRAGRGGGAGTAGFADAQVSLHATQADSGMLGARMALGRALSDPRDSAMGGAVVGSQAEDFQSNEGGNGSLQLSFATSLSQIRSAAAAAEQQRVAAAAPGFASGLTTSSPQIDQFDFWIEGKFAEFSGAGESDGRFGLLSVGADYVFNRNLLIGVMGQMDSMRLRDDVDPSEVKGIGFLVGPYATVRLTDEVFLQARAAWGRSDNEVSPFATYTDSFETTRWLLASTLAGSWTSGAWRFDPSATIAYMQDNSDAYRDTYGVLIPSVKSELGQMRAGPKIAYRSIANDGTLIEPFAGAEVIWNFADDLSTGLNAVIDDGLAGPTGVRGRLELGLRSTSASGTSLDFSGSYDGVGSSDYGAWTGRASARIPLQ